MPRVTDWAGITKTPTGYFVKVQVRPFPAKARRFKVGTKLAKMQAWRDDTKRQLQKQRDRMRPGDGPETMEAAVVRYLGQWGKGKHPVTIDERKRYLAWWAQRFEGRQRHTLTSAEIEEALSEWQHADGFGAASWNKRRIAIRMLFEVLDRGAGLPNPVNPVPTAKEPKPQARGLPMPLVRELLAGVSQPDHQARLALMAFVGLPPEEVSPTTEADVDLKARSLYVRSAKYSPAATVPLLPEAVSWLKRFHELGAYGRFSLNRHGDAFRQAVAFVNGARAARGEARLKGLRPYDLRHSFGTEFYRVTKDLKATKEAMRHAVLTTTERYIEGSVSEVLQQGVDAVAAAFARDTQPDTHGDTHRGARRGSEGVRTGRQRPVAESAKKTASPRKRRNVERS
jgi:integrase